MVPGERRLMLIEILGIRFFIIWVLSPHDRIKVQLTDRHAGIDFDRTGVHVCHLQRNRVPEAGIDPAPGLVERDPEPAMLDCDNS